MIRAIQRRPTPSPHFVQHHIARYFEQHVAHDEESGTEPIGGVAQRQVSLQLEFGKADVDAVEESK